MRIIDHIRHLSQHLNTKRFGWFAFVLLISAIYLANTLHDSYPDEFDNILGGRYILEGKVIYRDIFTHHGPVPYYLAALVELVSGRSFVRFRLIYSFVLLGVTFVGFYVLKKRFKSLVAFYPFFILVLAISSTYFWGHMLLADNVSAFLLTPVYLIILLSSIYLKPITLGYLSIISLFSSLALLSSLTHTYLVGILLFSSWLIYLRGIKGERGKKIITALIVLIVPYLIFVTYLLLTRSLDDYIQQNIVFNAKYYIYNYPRPEGSGRINPLRFAIIIAKDFYSNFTALLINSKDFNFSFPFNTALAVGNATLLLVLLLTGRYLLALFLWLSLIYTNARSNPLTSGETDYQSAVYMMISMANIAFLLPYLYQLINKNIDTAKRVLFGFLWLLVSTYSFFGFIFLLQKFADKVFNKYMGKAPLIYDRPQLAPIMNRLASKDDYIWIGPFEFEELFYTQGKIPSKYFILIPGIGKWQEIHDDLLSDFAKNKPKVIMFDRRFFILGSSPEMHAKFFLDFLAQNYVTLSDYRDGDIHYVSVIPITERVDLETKLYIDKEKVEEVVATLLAESLIQPKRVD